MAAAAEAAAVPMGLDGGISGVTGDRAREVLLPPSPPPPRGRGVVASGDGEALARSAPRLREGDPEEDEPADGGCASSLCSPVAECSSERGEDCCPSRRRRRSSDCELPIAPP